MPDPEHSCNVSYGLSEHCMQGWTDTLRLLESIVTEEQVYSVEKSIIAGDDAEFTLPFHGRYRYTKTDRGPADSSRSPSGASAQEHFIDLTAVPVPEYLLLHIIDSRRAHDPIAWSLPASCKATPDRSQDSAIKESFMHHVLRKLPPWINRPAVSAEDPTRPESTGGQPTFVGYDPSPYLNVRNETDSNFPSFQSGPRSDLDPLGVRPTLSDRPPPLFFPDGNLIGPTHPGFGPRNPFAQPNISGRPVRFDPFDPVSRRGDPDPDHAPVPGGFGRGFPNGFF